MCKSHSSVFLLIVNVQISSRRPSFEIQSIQALRQVLGQKHHTPDGIESSLGFFCKRVTAEITLVADGKIRLGRFKTQLHGKTEWLYQGRALLAPFVIISASPSRWRTLVMARHHCANYPFFSSLMTQRTHQRALNSALISFVNRTKLLFRIYCISVCNLYVVPVSCLDF